MTLEEVIDYERKEGEIARKRAQEVQQMIKPSGLVFVEVNEHELVANWLTELKSYRANMPALTEATKAVTAKGVIELIEEINSGRFYCCEDMCSGKKDCVNCAIDYITQRIREVYKCGV